MTPLSPLPTSPCALTLDLVDSQVAGLTEVSCSCSPIRKQTGRFRLNLAILVGVERVRYGLGPVIRKGGWY